MALDNIKRSLSVTESIIVTSLDVGGIDYKVKEDNNTFYFYFSTEEKVEKAFETLSRKLEKHDFEYTVNTYIIRGNKWFVLYLGRKQFFFEVEKVPNILNKAKSILFGLLFKK